MSTANAIRRFLEDHHVRSETMPHAHTATALASARVAQVDAESMAKAVMVGDDQGLLMAVVPASHYVEMRELRRQTGRPLHLVPEREFAGRFPDCELGAIPPFGEAYGMPMIWDDCLAEKSDIYFEAGDHESLMHLSARDFVDLVRSSSHGCISIDGKRERAEG
jgi:Ala-tRNA(Pro) deacylase